MNKKSIEAYDALCIALEKLHDLDESDSETVAAALLNWADNRRGPTYKAAAQQLLPFLRRPRTEREFRAKVYRALR